jgi:Gluconate 2-dehydrogenase subunit 3
MEKEANRQLKRRDLLKAITAVPAAALVPLAPAAAAPAKKSSTGATAQAAEGYKRQVLDDHEWKTIGVLSDLIIPADDRSGSATQAGVPEFIDDWLAFKGGERQAGNQGGELQAQIRGGLTWLDLECQRLFKHDFVECTEAQQKQMLDRIAYPRKAAPQDANAVAFFNHLRDLVVSGFFSSRMGVADLPYLGNKAVAVWEGCPPEVLVRIEQNLEKQGVGLKLHGGVERKS